MIVCSRHLRLYHLFSRKFKSVRSITDCTSKKNKYFITTPIFYVNSSPHIGHLYTALLADAAQRFQRLLGNEPVLFMTGTDEHGTKIQQAASQAKTPPSEYCDSISTEYKALFHQFGVDYTHFIRTSDEDHVKAVHHFWNQLESRGHIYPGHYAGWYCVADEAFLSDAQLAASDGSSNRVSAESGRPVHWMEESNFKFRLSNFQGDLLHWLKDERVVQPAKFHSQLVQWVSEGAVMQDVSVSRPANRVHWAVQVPGNADQTVYVWLDALVSYLTASGYPETLFCWPPHCQTLGKDILKFHGVYWPAFLMAAGLEPPALLTVHSHWTVNDEKMSKSVGNVVSPAEAAQALTADGLRYFLLRQGTLHADANYSQEKAVRMLNAELADTLGNLLHRCCGKVNARQLFPAFNPQHYHQYCQDDGHKLLGSLQTLPDEVAEHYSSFNYYKGVEAIMSVLHEANRFVESSQPWKLEAGAHLDCVLHLALESLRVCGIALQPVVPTLCDLLLDRLNIPQTQRSWQQTSIHSQTHTTQLSAQHLPLYRRIVPAARG